MPNISPKVQTEQFLFKLTPRLKRQLSAKAKKAGVTRGEYLRKLILMADIPQPTRDA